MSCSVFSSTHSLMQMFDGKLLEFTNDIENVHMVWLAEIQQEANRMFSSDFSAEPELMPKTPSQKKSNRRKRVSLGRSEKVAKRRFSKGKRSNLRRSSVNTLNLIAEDDVGPEPTTSEVFAEEPKCSTRRSKQGQSEEAELLVCSSSLTPPSSDREPERSPDDKFSTQIDVNNTHKETETRMGLVSSTPDLLSVPHGPPKQQMAEVVVKLSAADRRSAEKLMKAEPSPGRCASKITIASTTPSASRRSSVRHSLTLRRSLAGLRHSMTQESVRQASRRSFLKKKARMGSSTCSSNVSEDVILLSDDEEEVEVITKGVVSEEPAEAEVEMDPGNPEATSDVNEKKAELHSTRFTRSMAQNTPTMVPSASIINRDKGRTPSSGSDGSGSGKKPQSALILRTRPSSKRKGAETAEEFPSPRKKPSPPKKSQTAVRPNMRSFLHSVQKNQLLMMTPSSLGRGSVMRSFIKHTTPLKTDPRVSPQHPGLLRTTRLLRCPSILPE